MTPYVSTPLNYIDSSGTLAKHYKENQSLYNAGLIGLGTTAAYKTMQSAFDNNNQQQGGLNGAVNGITSWLLPMAVIGGGAWLLNKYGPQIKEAIHNWTD